MGVFVTLRLLCPNSRWFRDIVRQPNFDRDVSGIESSVCGDARDAGDPDRRPCRTVSASKFCRRPGVPRTVRSGRARVFRGISHAKYTDPRRKKYPETPFLTCRSRKFRCKTGFRVSDSRKQKLDLFLVLLSALESHHHPREMNV